MILQNILCKNDKKLNFLKKILLKNKLRKNKFNLYSKDVYLINDEMNIVLSHNNSRKKS
jgi:hypothetical protein